MKKPSYLINSIMFAIADAIYYRDDITAFHKRKEMIYTVSLYVLLHKRNILLICVHNTLVMAFNDVESLIKAYPYFVKDTCKWSWIKVVLPAGIYVLISEKKIILYFEQRSLTRSKV